MEGLVYPFILFSSIPLVVNNLILVYPPQSDCEKIHSFSLLEGFLMDSKSVSEEEDIEYEEEPKWNGKEDTMMRSKPFLVRG